MPERVWTEGDWRLFRSRIGDWQEAHMERLNKSYVELLESDAKPSVKFWELEKRIREDKRDAGVIVRMSRSLLVSHMAELLHEGAISPEDLDGFSDGLRDALEETRKTSM